MFAALRYGNNDYFVVQNLQSVVLMHPVAQQLFGKDMSDVKDPNGKRFGVEMLDIVKQKGSGFAEYFWPRAGSEKPQPKFAFVAGFAPWNWAF
jgi:methyl-accepting chemotaxis protein